jgi:hypothetical protein
MWEVSMVRTGLRELAITAATAALLLLPAGARAQTGTEALGTVHIPRKVMANGQPLAAGTYALRLTNETVPPVVGEEPGSERWVEFVQRGQVKGRELATVMSKDAVKEVAKEKPPAPGKIRVDLLKGGDYLRVWINHAGTSYLIHLATGNAS